MPKIADTQPCWICHACGEQHKAGDWFEYSTWHGGKCDVCQKLAPVTQPRDCGYLFESWMEHSYDAADN